MTQHEFERRKPHLNIWTIGHSLHGKTGLTMAIAKYFGDSKQRDRLFSTPQQKGPRRMRSPGYVEYETAARHYAHIDPAGMGDNLTNMITGGRVEGAILVCSAADGPMSETRLHTLLARDLGIPAIVVFLNKVDLVDDEEILEVVEQEIRALLSFYGFSGEDIPIVKGSALAALEDLNKSIGEDSVRALMAAVDEYIPTPEHLTDRPFFMPIEDVFSISGRGTVVTGRIDRGIVKVGDEVEIVGIRATKKTAVTGIEKYRKPQDEARAGENVGMFVAGVDREEVERGQVLCKPGTVKPHRRFMADAYILTREEGGRHRPFFTNYRPHFNFRMTDVTGVVTLPECIEMVMPGDEVTIGVILAAPLAIEEKLGFTIREGGRIIGFGIVARIVE